MVIIPADYWLILYIFITDFLPAPAPFSGRFPVAFCFFPAIVAGFSIRTTFPQMLKSATIYCFTILLCCHCSFRPYDITQHLLTIIIYTFCQYRVEDPDQLTRNCYHRLHLLQWILLPRPVIVVYFPEFFFLSYYLYRTFIQCVSQAFSSPVADTTFSIMLA